MSDERVYYDDGHWKITACPESPESRLHVYVAHNDMGDFPKCWGMEALQRFNIAIVTAMNLWTAEPD